MTTPRIAAVLASVVALSLFAPVTVAACTCTVPRPALAALADADAVFVGEALDVQFKASFLYRAAMRTRELWEQITGLRDEGLHEWYRSGQRGRVARLRVTERFKGADVQVISVHFSQDDDCTGYRFVTGERYLVFAWYNDEPGGRLLTINACGLTRPQSEVPDRLAELRLWLQGGSK